MATRTLSFQVSEELLQRIKTFLARYEQIYHRKLSQKEFLVQAILATEQTDRLEKSIRKVVREELQTASIATAVPSLPPDDAIPDPALNFLSTL